MPTPSDKVVALRRLLDERHPAARPREHRIIPTGVPHLDEVLGGGIRTGALTEFVSTCASTGSQTSLGSLLKLTRLARQRIAIVDAAGAFDIETLDNDLIAHVVWIRCQNLSECWRTADLVARDPNYAVTVVDVRGLPLRALLRTRDSIWVRLQRAVEQAETALLVQSHSSIAPNAAYRVEFCEPMPPQDLLSPRREITARISPLLQRRRMRQQEATA